MFVVINKFDIRFCKGSAVTPAILCNANIMAPFVFFNIAEVFRF